MQKKILTLLIVLGAFQLSAQQLDQIGKAKFLTASGGVSVNAVGYKAFGIEQRRDPLNYFISGNMNFMVWGFSVPLSFSYSNQQFSYAQPFNRASLHPSYKWVRAHIGTTSMNFSSYTLSGHQFSGVGLEIEPPGNWKFAAMYGRLQKAIDPDVAIPEGEQPAYERWGYGSKVRYGKGGNFIQGIVFKAADDKNSIRVPSDSLGIFPKDNLVLGVEGGAKLFNKLNLKVEYAASALTHDSQSIDAEPKETNPFGYLGDYFPYQQSTKVYQAFKGRVDYRFLNYAVGVGYERIDPEYQTLGAYYFNNDLENMTLNVASTFLKNRLNITTSGGLQKDNLDGKKTSEFRRLIGNVQVNVRPTKKLNINANYSNLQTHTNIRDQFDDASRPTEYDRLDTLNYTQVSQSAGFNVSYAISSSKKKRQSVNMNFAYQKASDSQNNNNSGGGFYNMNTAWSLALPEKNFNVSASVNVSYSEMMGTETLTIGPGVNFRRSFLNKKLKAGLGLNYNQNRVDNTPQGQVYNARFTGDYSPNKQHKVNFSLIAVHRAGTQSTDMTELTINIGYNTNFSAFSGKKKSEKKIGK